MNSMNIASVLVGQSKTMPQNASDGVVEIGLLLPARRAAELLQLAKDRQESIGQVLRKLIERELGGMA